MNKQQALEALSALAHETRLDAFKLLIKRAPAGIPAGALAEELGVLQNTMSTHLGILERAGLIQRDRDGRAIRCVADVTGMQNLLTYLLQDCCQGDDVVCAPLFEAVRCAC
jgi:DNA-binding transcriptional ArsR family regulator